jgi:hypothetical protein
MFNKQLLILSGLSFIAVSCNVLAAPIKTFSNTGPHFYLQMENASDKDVTISFKKGIGKSDLMPALSENTKLLAHTDSDKYGVEFHPLLPWDTFNITFTGKHDCNVNVAFYAPSDPKITLSGLGCNGGGYKIIDNGYTLLLYISDIN